MPGYVASSAVSNGGYISVLPVQPHMSRSAKPAPGHIRTKIRAKIRAKKVPFPHRDPAWLLSDPFISAMVLPSFDNKNSNISNKFSSYKKC
jgi:hypothetical protein